MIFLGLHCWFDLFPYRWFLRGWVVFLGGFLLLGCGVD